MSTPKMPHRISIVHKQILEHPDYATKLSDSTRWAFEAGCVGGGSACAKENNQWSRELWKSLYLGRTEIDNTQATAAPENIASKGPNM